MKNDTKMIARPRLAGLIFMALLLAGCGGGAGTVANTGETSSISSPPPTTPLTLQGSPPTSVTAGTLYSFTPTVSPSTAGVTFAITRKPAWASFDSSTGALRGIPSAGNEGMTNNITITASNTSTTASIGPFAIAVDAPVGSPAPATGSATLTWVAPDENIDGSVLTNLAGYHIYYGTTADAMTEEIDVAGADSTSYVVDGLTPGTYYFTVTAYSSSGTESTDSNLGTKTI
jgi:hypothetical protein